MKNASYLFLFVLLVSACNGWHEGNRLLSRADSLMYTHPDSAFQLLNHIPENDRGRMSEGQRMRYQLLRADAQNKLFVKFTTDSALKEVVAYYNSKGAPDERLRANYLLGRAYYDMGEIPMALKFFHEAADQADTTRRDCDFKLLCRVHGQMGRILLSNGAPENSLSELQSAIDLAYKANDTLMALSCYDFMGSAYEKQNKLDSAVLVTLEASRLYDKYGYPHRAAMSTGSIVDILVDRKEYTKAKELLDRYKAVPGLFDDEGNIRKGKEAFYRAEGLYYKGIGKYDSARHCFYKLAKSAQRFNDKEGAYEGLTQVYQAMGARDSALKYALLAYSYNDSSYREKASEDIRRNHALYNYARYEQLAEREIKEAARTRVNWIFSLALSAVVILVLLLAMSAMKHRRKAALLEQYELKDRIKELTEVRKKLEDKQAELQKSQQELAQSVSEKDRMIEEGGRNIRELDSKYRQSVEAQELVIEELKQQLEELESQTSNYDRAEAEQKLQTCKTRSVLAYLLKSKGHSMMKDDEWRGFKNEVDTILPGFSVFLFRSCPGLRPIEKKILYLTRCSFTTSEMGTLLDKPASTVSSIKARLSENIFGKTSGTKDLEKRLKDVF